MPAPASSHTKYRYSLQFRRIVIHCPDIQLGIQTSKQCWIESPLSTLDNYLNIRKAFTNILCSPPPPPSPVPVLQQVISVHKSGLIISYRWLQSPCPIPTPAVRTPEVWRFGHVIVTMTIRKRKNWKTGKCHSIISIIQIIFGIYLKIFSLI